MTTFSQYELGGMSGPGKKEPFTYKEWAHFFLFIILVFAATFVFNNFSIVGVVLLGGIVLLVLVWMAKMFFQEADEREHQRSIMSIAKSIKRNKKKSNISKKAKEKTARQGLTND